MEPLPSGAEELGAPPAACPSWPAAPRRLSGDGEADRGRLEWMSPLRRAFGVAELGKKRGSEEGGAASLPGAELLFRAFLKALPSRLPRSAEPGAKSGLPALLPA